MTKNALLAVTLAIMAAAYAAGAETSEIDFDQTQAKSGYTAPLNQLNKETYNYPAIPEPSNELSNSLFIKLDKNGMKRLREEIPGIPELSEEFEEAINDIESSVLYNYSSVVVLRYIPVGGYVILTETNKHLLEFLNFLRTRAFEESQPLKRLRSASDPSIPVDTGYHGIGDPGPDSPPPGCGPKTGVPCPDQIPS